MEQILEYYFNITYFKEHVLLQIKCFESVKKCLEPIKYNVPDFEVLGRKSEEITKKILNIEKKLPEGQRYLMSIEEGGFSTEIVPKKTLEELCNMLNEGREKEIFKLAA